MAETEVIVTTAPTTAIMVTIDADLRPPEAVTTMTEDMTVETAMIVDIPHHHHLLLPMEEEIAMIAVVHTTELPMILMTVADTGNVGGRLQLGSRIIDTC